VTKFKAPPQFNPFFVFLYVFVWAVLSFVGFIILRLTFEQYIKSKVLLASAAVFLSLLLTHILFRLIGKRMRTSRGRAIDGSDVFIPFYLGFMKYNAPDILNFVSWFLRRIFNIRVDFEANGNYSEWIAIATAFQLLLVFIFILWLLSFAHLSGFS